MRFRLRDLPAMLRTPAGRMHVRQGIAYRSWPLLSPLARMYRRTLVRKTRVIAVVGSFGKSTTTRAIAAALGVPEHDSMLSNSWFWIAFALLRIRPGQRHAVIEVGISKPGQMKGYARTVGPDVAVITAIGSEHHRSLGTLEVTRAEKSWMLQVLPASGAAVLNGDDPNVMWMKEKTRARVVTFGFGAECDVRADEVRLDWPRGTYFRLTAFGEERDVAVRLLGRHMIYPILAAIAVSHIEGYALDATLARLRELAPTPGRMDPVLLPNGVTVLRDDFKSTLGNGAHRARRACPGPGVAPRRAARVGVRAARRPAADLSGAGRAHRRHRLASGRVQSRLRACSGRGLDAGGMPRTSVTDAGRSCARRGGSAEPAVASRAMCC